MSARTAILGFPYTFDATMIPSDADDDEGHWSAPRPAAVMDIERTKKITHPEKTAHPDSPDSIATALDMIPPKLATTKLNIPLTTIPEAPELKSRAPLNMHMLVHLAIVVISIIGLFVVSHMHREALAADHAHESSPAPRAFDRPLRAWTFPASVPRDPDGAAQSFTTAIKDTISLWPLGSWLVAVDSAFQSAAQQSVRNSKLWVSAADAWGTAPPLDVPPVPTPRMDAPATEQADRSPSILMLALRPDLVARDLIARDDVHRLMLLDTSYGW